MSELVSPRLLKRTLILQNIDPEFLDELASLSIESSVDSTNSAVQRLPVAEQHAAAILAEQQTTGRGRRGRMWHSPYAKNLYLSLGWKFEKSLTELGCLPLVVALSVAGALSRAGLTGHKIKWPNDILLGGRKLSGCLVEMQVNSNGFCNAVIGVGINVDMPESESINEISQPWTDLRTRLPDCSRNGVAALLLEELIRNLKAFESQGFTPFASSWVEMDVLQGALIEVFSGDKILTGTAAGIDDAGALLLDTGKEVLSLHSGEVSLRKTELVL
jgi:BirA family biotin operon repressor/biotin-[acetyl-CoA-carboxylase] ligase